MSNQNTNVRIASLQPPADEPTDAETATLNLPTRSRGVGSLSWARRTGGHLSTADRLRLAGQAVALQLRGLSKTARRRLGLSASRAIPDFDALAAPDTRIARLAEEALAASSPAPLIHHVYRTYAWGRILAARDGRRLDVELFYVASLLHDLGLVLDEDDRPEHSSCFAYDGAEDVLRRLRSWGVDEARAEIVADAICLHLNVRVGISAGPEAHYLNRAAGIDVIGLGRRAIPRSQSETVLTQHPRNGFRTTVGDLLTEEVETRPGCRIHFLYQRFAFGRQLRGA